MALANHNHDKYNMSSTLMVTKNFVQFVECVFPEETDDETVTHKWGVCKTNEQFVAIEAARKCFETVMCILSERKEMNIMCSKTLKTFSEHPNDMSASKLAWRYDGCAFKEHFNVIFEIINTVLASVDQVQSVCASFSGAIKNEIRNTCDMYKEVLHCLFWDALFHKKLSELNSKETLTLAEISFMFLLGLDMLANFNVVGLKVTFNMRFVSPVGCRNTCWKGVLWR